MNFIRTRWTDPTKEQLLSQEQQLHARREHPGFEYQDFSIRQARHWILTIPQGPGWVYNPFCEPVIGIEKCSLSYYRPLATDGDAPASSKAISSMGQIRTQEENPTEEDLATLLQHYGREDRERIQVMPPSLQWGYMTDDLLNRGMHPYFETVLIRIGNQGMDKVLPAGEGWIVHHYRMIPPTSSDYPYAKLALVRHR